MNRNEILSYIKNNKEKLLEKETYYMSKLTIPQMKRIVKTSQQEYIPLKIYRTPITEEDTLIVVVSIQHNNRYIASCGITFIKHKFKNSFELYRVGENKIALLTSHYIEQFNGRSRDYYTNFKTLDNSEPVITKLVCDLSLPFVGKECDFKFGTRTGLAVIDNADDLVTFITYEASTTGLSSKNYIRQQESSFLNINADTDRFIDFCKNYCNNF